MWRAVLYFFTCWKSSSNRRAPKLKWLGVFAIVLISSCATPFQPRQSNFFSPGGYWEKKGPGYLINVGFVGNGYTKSDQLKKYVIYYSALIAKREKHDYFFVYANLTDAAVDKRVDYNTANISSVTVNPSHVYIRLSDIAGTQSLQADEVIKKYKNEIEGNIK